MYISICTVTSFPFGLAQARPNYRNIGIMISFLMNHCVLTRLVPLSHQVVNSTTLADIASIILGVAVIAQWCGILRFLSYFDKYNMLLLTLRLAMPSVLRFIVCAGILYIAFLLCGWLVMGPYHPKVECIACDRPALTILRCM